MCLVSRGIDIRVYGNNEMELENGKKYTGRDTENQRERNNNNKHVRRINSS